MRPSDPSVTKMISDAHLELLRGRRKPKLRPSARSN
jgi:hypothetical protein